MDRYFILSCRSRFDGNRKYHLKSPEPINQDEFNTLIHRLTRSAALKLVDDERFHKKLIGWKDIIEEVADMLVIDHGYTLLSPKKCEFKSEMGWINDHYPMSESDKSLGEDVLREIFQHNDITSWDDCHHQAVS